MDADRSATPAPCSKPRRLVGIAWSALLVGALVASLPSRARAESDVESRGDLKKLSLEELFNLEVTSVSTRPEPLSTTPAAVRVVTGDEIRRMGVLSIPEALRYIPGVEVARVDNRSYAISARGFNGTIANKLLVLIDGRSVYTPLFSGVFWDAQDALQEDIEQIEVIRGPGATVWGANAVNGVINVLSKRAADTQGFLITGGGGNPERGFGGIRYGGKLGSRVFYRAYGKTLDRDASVRPNGQEAGDDFRMSQGGFRVDGALAGSSEFTIQGDLYDGAVDQPSTDDVTTDGRNLMTRWTRRLSERSDVQLNAYYDHTLRDIPLTFRETLDTYDASLRHRLPFGKRHDVVWGLGYRQTQDVVGNSPGLAFLPSHLERSVYSGFVQDEIELSQDRLRWTIGSKVEHNDYTGVELEPSTRLAWIPEPTQTLWGSVSRAVRAPSRIDRDLFVPATPPFLLAGGPGFDSEVLWAYELGYKAQPRPNLTASVATFYNDYDKLRSLEGTAPPFVLGNGLEGQSYGAEGMVALQAARWWRVDAGYTFLRMILRASPSSTDTTQAKTAGDSPRHQWFTRSSLNLAHGIELDLGVRSCGELPNQKVPAYTACDARLGWRPGSGFELAVVGQNLFDSRHPEFGTPASRKEVERSLYGKATWTY